MNAEETQQQSQVDSPMQGRRGVSGRRLCDSCAQRKAEVKVTLDEISRRLCTTCAAREQKERASLDAMAAGPKCEEVYFVSLFYCTILKKTTTIVFDFACERKCDRWWCVARPLFIMHVCCTTQN